jgi:hypothetical protein
MKKGNQNKDIKVWAYIIGYGIAIAFLLLPYAVDAAPTTNNVDPIHGFNYKKHYKKQKRHRIAVKLFNVNNCRGKSFKNM